MLSCEKCLNNPDNAESLGGYIGSCSICLKCRDMLYYEGPMTFLEAKEMYAKRKKRVEEAIC